MRGAAFLLVLILLVPITVPGAHADGHSLRAAVAPAQSLVDAVPSLVEATLREASLLGRAPEGFRILWLMENYTASLASEWTLPERSTHREAALAALPYAREVYFIVEPVPSDAALLADVTTRCLLGETTRSETFEARAAYATLLRIADDLETTSPPEGVRAQSLFAAAASLREWLVPYEVAPECVYFVGDDPEHFVGVRVSTGASSAGTSTPLRIGVHEPTGPDAPPPEFSPEKPIENSSDPIPRTWPGGSVTVSGVTTERGSVRTRVPALDIEEEATPDSSGRYRTTLEVPPDAAPGYYRVVVETVDEDGNVILSDSYFEVTTAPSTLDVEAPTSVRPGSRVAIPITLESPLDERTRNARILVNGDTEATLELVDGRVILVFDAPDERGPLEFTIVFEGDDVVDRAETTVRIDVGDPPVLADAADADADAARASLLASLCPMVPFLGIDLCILLLILAILTIALAYAYRRWSRRVTPAGTPAPATETPAPTAASAPSFAALTILAIFTTIARFMRARGLASPASTARDLGASLRVLGADPGVLVTDFERARYGNEAPEPAWHERARSWFEVAWARLTGGAS